MGVRLWASGALAIVGGFLMVVSGYTSRGLLFLALGYAQEGIPSILNGFAASAASLAVSILELIIALGGLTVLIGGAVILFHHVRTGRVLIYLGGGAGLLSLVVGFGFTAYRLGGWQPALAYLPYWVGLAMAVTARRVAKGVH
jgi:hypothetical protein